MNYKVKCRIKNQRNHILKCNIFFFYFDFMLNSFELFVRFVIYSNIIIKLLVKTNVRITHIYQRAPYFLFVL